MHSAFQCRPELAEQLFIVTSTNMRRIKTKQRKRNVCLLFTEMYNTNDTLAKQSQTIVSSLTRCCDNSINQFFENVLRAISAARIS